MSFGTLSEISVDSNFAAFITVRNPLSQQLSPQENVPRHQELKAHLKTLGRSFVDGIGQHPSNDWHGEPSVLTLNLNRECAKVLAAQYEQHAFGCAVLFVVVASRADVGQITQLI